MAQAVSVEEFDLTGYASGTSIELTTSSVFNYYRLYTTVVASGAMDVAAATVPTGVVVFNVILDADITFGGGGSFTFFGVSVAESYLKQGTLLTATYNGASYAVSIQPSFSQSGFIQGSDIADTTIPLTKLTALPSAQIVVGSSGNVPTAVTMSGDATLSNTGALSIAAGAIGDTELAVDAVRANKIKDGEIGTAKLEASLQAFFSNSATEYYQELAIPAASVLTLFATPVTIVAAQGSGKKIIVKRATLEVDFNTTAYTTNGTLELACSGAGAAQATSTANNGLFASVSRESNIAINSAAGVGDSVIIANTALVVRVASANPAAGNSDITVRVWYSIEQ
jgi:hypothetical protein